MKTKIKDIFAHSILKNSFALFCLQAVNIIAPLVVLPYLSRVLGVDGFGLILLCLSACALSQVFTDFGFNLSATFLISKARGSIDYISEYVGAVFLIKLLIVMVIIGVIIAYSLTVGFDVNASMVPLYLTLNIVAQSFIPLWFFQGIEKMKNLTIFMAVPKIIYVVLILLLIHKEDDAELVILILFITNLISLTLTMLSIYQNGYRIKAPSKVTVIEAFKGSLPFFLSRASVALYTSGSTFLLGAFSGLNHAAQYGASEKLYQATQSVTGPLSQALYPYMANHQKPKLLVKIVLSMLIPLSLGCALLFYNANDLIFIVFGEGFEQAVIIFKVFILITIVNFISVNFGYPAFASINKVNVPNTSVYVGGLIQGSGLFFLYLLNEFSAFSVVVLVLCSETIVMLIRLVLFNFYVREVKYEQSN